MGDGTLHVEHDVLARVDDQFDELAAADTLPAYRTLLEEDHDVVRALLQQDVGERVEQMRTLPHRLDDIAAQLADWHVEVEQ
ncbi:hypothetical protein [Pseudokineococcus sp. 1T1Z-3]|uniref:hypothetical protein n=1 Tax=Pseudokineococcus sp. 1T1Z-3 TaxID=3132745 RepID=UPI0030A76931